MNKNRFLKMAAALLLLGTSAGCSGNNHANLNNVTRPMGYYSNENHQNNTSALFADNDGPITELMDHSLGAESEITDQHRRKSLQTRDENGNPPNPTGPLAKEDQFFHKDNRFSTGDVNYHNQLSQNINNTGSTTDHKTLSKITDQIRRNASKVKNVRDVRSVTYGSSVLISVDLIDNTKADQTMEAVKRAVKPYVKNRAVTVLTDEGTFSRDRTGQTKAGQR